jgi:hypothetical protein
MKTVGVGRQVLPFISPGTPLTVTIGVASAATTGPVGASVIELVSTVACYIAIGANPTATSSTGYLAANVPVFYVVDPTSYVAALQVSAGGTLFVIPAA